MSRSKLNEQVYITGVGCSRFGDLLNTPELKGLSVQELTATAVKEALDDAGLSGQDVDAVFAGNAMVHSSQVPGTYTQLSKWTGTQFKAGVHFEAQCSTTNVGAAMAAMAIASGICTAETIGYLAHGKGLNTARDGRLRFDGDRPMSTHGGRQATACPAGNIRYSYPRLRNDWHGGCAGGSLT